MTALLLAVALFLLAAVVGLARTILTGELRGLLSDRCRRRIDRAASLLPVEIADDLADEWRAELDAFEADDRLVSAWRFTRTLPQAGRALGVSRSPTSLGLAGSVQGLSGVMGRWRAQLVGLRAGIVVLAQESKPLIVIAVAVSGTSLVFDPSVKTLGWQVGGLLLGVLLSLVEDRVGDWYRSRRAR
jgi:hypothetical protein